MSRRFKLAGAAAIALLLAVGSLVAVGVVTEGALHPPLRRRASDTAALAQSTSAAVSGAARQVTIRAADGVSLKGWWIVPGEWNGRAVIACHGVADSGIGVMGDALLFLRNGYAVLVPDSRGHGESGGLVSYGVQESEDMLGWIAWVSAQGARKVYGFGESLGGAILLESLGRGAKLDAVVAECAYSSFEAVARERVAHYGHVPRWLAAAIVEEAILYAYVARHVALSDARPEHAVRGVRTPILLIHGKEDRETSPTNSEEIFRNAACAQLWLVPHAGHTGAYAAAPREFERRVIDWFRDGPAQATAK
ncbi:MAG: alpha/beta fold hydrolase [Acidobacteriaceae bacterium]|nr:alpha/beta fold hydrolase [Acidobacteriaceae bacterium]